MGAKGGMQRRDFLRLGAAAGVAAGLVQAAEGPATPPAVRLGIIGVGGRGTYLLGVALAAGVEVPALCDIHEGRLANAIGVVERARGGRRAEGYSRGPQDYRRMLARDDLDAVLVATPMQLHAPMCSDALRAGKHVLSEVAAAMTLEDCWGLVRAAEETGKLYMLAENCCYYQQNLMVLNMAQRGVFGEMTFAECGYVHDCRSLMFAGDGSLTWRGEMTRDFQGNLYPTHSLGPVAQWLGIHRGDRMVSLVASATKQAALADYVARHFPEGHAARRIQFRCGDSASVLIRTARGALIDLRYDISSPRPVPSTTYYTLQGLRAAYESKGQLLWIEGRSRGHEWEPAGTYAREFEHPKWAQWQERARQTGHSGGDFFVIQEFLDALRTRGPSPIDAADAAAWSAIIPLSGRSLAENGAPQEIPDFTRGKWEARRG